VSRDLLAGDDGSYAWHLADPGGVNATDASVGIRTAEDFAPEQTGEVDVGSVNGASTNLIGAFHPQDGSTDYRDIGHVATHSQKK
jgi:hypothetical protein